MIAIVVGAVVLCAVAGPERPASADDSVQIPIEAPLDGWTVRGSLPPDEPELWVGKVVDRSGQGFSDTIHPFQPARIPEGAVQISNEEVVPLSTWLGRDLDCSD